jgi:hypothetical protein
MPMQANVLRAISIGYRVDRGSQAPRTLSVHSRFRHALNLHAPGGGLLAVLSGEGGDFPTGIRVALPAQWDWRQHAFDGMPVVMQGGGLNAGPWRIDLQTASVWQAPALQATLDVARLLRLTVLHEGMAWRLRTHAAAHEGLVQLLPQWPSGARAVTLGPDGDPLALSREVGALVGYGAGLTPDGDDYLLGYLAALWPFRCDRMVGAHRCHVAEAVQRNLSRTTDISRHYLQLAIHGHFSAPLVALLHAFAGTPAQAGVLPRVDAVLNFGATSGADTLAGMLHGIRTLQAIAGCASTA